MTPIRITVWAWGEAIDDLERLCLPSLMQPNNVPWLMANGHSVTIDFGTVDADIPRIAAIGTTFHAQLAARGPANAVAATLASIGPGGDDEDTKARLLNRAIKFSVAERAPVIFAFANRYFGDGSIRNIVTYARRPGLVVAGLDLRVEPSQLYRGLEEHAVSTAGSPVSNARLADICFDGLEHQARGEFFPIGNEAVAIARRDVEPVLAWFVRDDLDFFERFACRLSLLTDIWPGMAAAKNRWRVLASTDLFCVASGGPSDSDDAGDDLVGRLQESYVFALRRESL